MNRALCFRSLWWFTYRRRLPRSTDEADCVFRLGLYAGSWKLAHV